MTLAAVAGALFLPDVIRGPANRPPFTVLTAIGVVVLGLFVRRERAEPGHERPR